jgi:hypothetical protein
MAVVHDRGVSSFDVAHGPGYLTIGDRCVVFGDVDGTSGDTVVFRDGQASWDAAGHSIRYRELDGDWIALRDGDHLILAGYDLGDVGGVPPPPPWVVLPALECPGEQWLATEVIRVRE